MRIHDPRLRTMAQTLSLSVSLLSNELTFIFLFAITAAFTFRCRVAALKVSPYIIHSAEYILLLVL